MTMRKKGFSVTDDDFSAVYAAVNIILDLEKPKKRQRLFQRLEIAANIPVYGASTIPSVSRARDCLAEALRRWGERNLKTG